MSIASVFFLSKIDEGGALQVDTFDYRFSGTKPKTIRRKFAHKFQNLIFSIEFQQLFYRYSIISKTKLLPKIQQ